jgi:CDP-glycerol glycerophosphotransferase
MLERYDVGGLFRGAFSECGYPRLDSTLNAGPEEKAALRRKLGVGPDARVVLYAPTWRGELGDAHVDTERLLTDIKLLAGLDCALVFRGHHLVEKMLTDLPLGIRVASSEIDTNELLSVVDILITDYSSIFFDFMATGRPILHYVYDLETYSRERGLYFDLGELPGDKCHDLSQLRDVLQGHLKTPFTPGEGYRQAQRRFCPQDDGGAARRVVDTVFYGMDRWALTRPVDERQSLLFFLGSFMPNGITTSFINLVNNLDRRRFRPTVIVEPLNMAAFPERLEQFAKIPKDVAVLGRVGQMNLTIEERWVREEFESRHKLASPALWHIYQQAFRREYARIFGQSRFDVLINFDGYARFWASTFAFGPDGSRKVIYQHNDMFDEWKVRFPYLGGIFNLCRHQDGLISVSPSVLESNLNNLQTPFSLDDQVFDFCNNPINPSLVQSLAQEGLETPAFHDFSKETAVRFVTMGRLSPEKDHAKLIRAFTQVHAQNPDTALYILGDGPLRHQLENQITTLGLHRAVHLLGQQSNPFPFLKQADCFVFSSNHEGQGLVLLEALILGRPAVSTDIPGPRSVLEGGYGHLVDNSEAGLVQGMSDFLDGKLSFKAFDARQYQTEAMEMFYDKVCQAGQPGKGRNRVG